MKTEGLNQGLSLQGAGRRENLTLGSKNDPSASKLDSFAKLMSSKTQAPKKDMASFVRDDNKPIAKRAEPDDKSPAVNEPKTERQGSTKTDSKKETAKADSNDETARVDSKLEKKGAKKAPGAREEAMLEFMDSMESEFGIPPEQIVEAMALLPKDQQLQSPEQTAEQVIDTLGLPPEQAERAYSLYMGFLNQMAQNPPTPTKPELVVAVPTSQMAQNALAAKDRKANLSASLDRMNDKFFMQDRSSMATDRMTAQAPMEASQLVDKLSFEKAQGYPVLQPDLKGIPNSKSELMPHDPNLMQTSQDQQGADPMNTLMAKLAAVGASAAALGEAAAGAGQAQNAQGSKAQGGPEGQPGAGGLTGLTGLTGSAAAAIMSGNENSGFGSDSSAESEGGDFSRTDGLEGLGRGHEGMKTEGKLGFQELLQASTTSVAGGKNNEVTNANIEKLMNQAQIIARKGGGEATIRMTPEGLGKVELRVIVKDGRVNVEMATETREARKMIESSLSDLKMGLAGHKLSLDSLKVDTSLQSSADQLNQQQKNPDQRPDQGRDQARQMFQQFRDENFSRREPFFEMSGSKAYRTASRAVDPLSPATEAKVQRSVEGRGERMNLVA